MNKEDLFELKRKVNKGDKQAKRKLIEVFHKQFPDILFDSYDEITCRLMYNMLYNSSKKK